MPFLNQSDGLPSGGGSVGKNGVKDEETSATIRYEVAPAV